MIFFILVKRNKTGSTMLFAVLVLSFILIMGLSVAQTIFIEQRLTSGYKDSQAAYFAAESGIEYAMKSTGCFPESSEDIVWLDGEVQKVGFRVWDQDGMTHSLGISNGVKREISMITVRRSDLILDTGGTVDINDLPSDYSCMNASYTNLTANANVGDKHVAVSDVSGFVAGDGVLIAQMANDTGGGYGQIIDNYGGVHEDVIVSVAKDNDSESGTIELEKGLVRNFLFLNSVTQVVSIKQFNSITIKNNTTLTAPSYNRFVGGILALYGKDFITVELGSRIDMSGKGYFNSSLEGGVKEACASGDYDYGQYVCYITCSYPVFSDGSGPGGGGGGSRSTTNGVASSGGGGSISNGVLKAPISNSDCNKDVAHSSTPLNTYTASARRFLMGSAGGSGLISMGASGGGAIRLKTRELILSGNIESNGADAQVIGDDFLPGGGQGGSVLIKSQRYFNTTNIYVRGGNGIDGCALPIDSTSSSGGSGGVVTIFSPFASSPPIANLSGGGPTGCGTTTSASGPMYFEKVNYFIF